MSSDPEILTALRALASLVVVRGNVDWGEWADALREPDVASIGGLSLYVLHDLAMLSVDPAAGGYAAVIFGHSHQPHVGRQGGVLYVNPGSAGPRRFRLPVTVARLTIEASRIEAEIVALDVHA